MAGRTKKEKFPEIKKSRQGAFTSWAKKNGFKDACSAASAVMKNTKKYSETTSTNLQWIKRHYTIIRIRDS